MSTKRQLYWWFSVQSDIKQIKMKLGPQSYCIRTYMLRHY